MDAKMKKTKSKIWTDKETEILLEEVQKEYAMLVSQLQNAVTSKKKQQMIWKRITDTVNGVGGENRTLESCKKRWKDLKSAFLHRPKYNSGTEGGKPAPPVPFEDLLEQIIGQTNLMEGIPDCQDICDGGSCLDYSEEIVPDSQAVLDGVESDLGNLIMSSTHVDGAHNFVVQTDNGNISNEVQPITGGQSQGITAKAPKRKKAKSRPDPTPVEEESETELHKQWLKSAIEKNKAQTEVAQWMKQKLILEVNILTNQWLGRSEHATCNDTE